MPARRPKLDEYRAKRDFGKTPEPAPESSQARQRAEKKTALEFVVQKHDATRLHYDVRLEIDGAMMSFAVPKGPSYDPSVKRLAIETEDHPMEYNRFEGRIPDGEYGAGDVLVWDRGTYETVPPGQEDAMRAKGHIHARFFGEKLHGAWHFVKTHGQKSEGKKAPRQWLMFKAEDETADPKFDVIAERPESVVSGRAATRGPQRVGHVKATETAKALLAKMGDVARPRQQEHISDPSRHWYELKYDGYRVLAGKVGPDVRLQSRNANDLTSAFRPIAEAIRALPARDVVIDGEACVVVDDEGHPSFGALQAWMAGERQGAKLAFAAFDLLWLDGRDLRALPIEERRELLEALLAKAGAPLSFSRAIGGERADDLARLKEAARAAGLEGLVAKLKGSPYVGGTSGPWKKIKFERRQDCVIVGWIPLKGTKTDIGALSLAVMDDGALRYAGRVGTGFDARARKTIAARLEAIARKSAAVKVPALEAKGVHWVEPTMVCEVAYGAWTNDGLLRHSTFIGLRDDKGPDECLIEAPSEDAAPVPPPPLSSKPGTKPDSKPRGVTLTNPTKVLFPRDGITKRDLCAYYTQIAPTLLPHLAHRPLTLQRYPDGIDGEAWYQQNAPDKTPDYVTLIPFEDKKRIAADNIETLMWLSNLAAITMHQWSARLPRLDRPNYVVIDLDPGDGTWAQLVEVAIAVRALLEALELVSAVKTTGKRGLHVVVPLAEGPTHEQATAFAELIAKAVAKVLPAIATAERMKERRKGRLYVDFLQNGEGKTIVSPYSVRALDGAPVSTPIAWSEVTRSLDPKRFTMNTVLERVGRVGDLFAPALSGRGRIPHLRA